MPPGDESEGDMPPTTGPRRPGVKQQTLYLPHDVHKRLKLLAFEEDKRQHDLLLEGLSLLFQSRGLPGLLGRSETR